MTKHLAFDKVRVGQKYHIRNQGESFDFEVEERIGTRNFIVKDLNSLERYQLLDFVRYGYGKDFEFHELF